MPAAPPFMRPFIALPSTRPTYVMLPTVNVMRSPLSFPALIGVRLPFAKSEPDRVCYFCCSVSSPADIFHVPFTFAGTI